MSQSNISHDEFHRAMVEAVAKNTEEKKLQLARILDEESKNLAKEMKKAYIPKTNQSDGSYNRGWGVSQKKRDGLWYVRNAKFYSIVHLLENDFKHRSGTVSRGKKHVKPLEEKYMAIIASRLENEL